VSFPKIPSGLDSRSRPESSHHETPSPPEVATGRNIALEIAGNAWRSFTQAMLTRAERPASHSNFTNSIRDYPLFQA
jgi:hypothetical protein